MCFLAYFALENVTTKATNISRPYVAEIEPEAGSSWGVWGQPTFCPEGSFAGGFQLKVESECGAFCDDTALNGIKLLCESPSGIDMGEARSSVGLLGAWKTPLLCHGEDQPTIFMRGVQFRSEQETRFKVSMNDILERNMTGRHLDETAGNNLNSACYGGTVLSGNGLHWGTWSGYELCPENAAICGLKTKVEGNQGASDDTALNKVVFYCCLL